MTTAINETRVLLTSAARTADTNTDSQENRDHRGLHLLIDVSAYPASASVVFTIQGYDPVADDWYTILASNAVTATGKTVLRVYPGLTASANTVANDVLPGRWRVNANHADTDSITYSLVAHLVV